MNKFGKGKDMKVYTIMVCIAASLLIVANVDGQDLPRTFKLDPKVLANVKKEIQSGSAKYSDALKDLKKNAEKAAKRVPPSVMEKGFTPPSGSKHDYMSMGKYWWPDPKKANGLPYIRRDGRVNPEVKKITDHDNGAIMINAVATLSAAYFYLGNEAYAAAGAKYLRVWFLDTATCMNPNLNYGQSVPGRNDGRRDGVLDMHGFCELIDAIGMLEGSTQLTAADRQGLHSWFQQYLVWLQQSDNGKGEFKFEIPQGSEILIIGAKGYKSVEVPITKSRVYNVTLQQ